MVDSSVLDRFRQSERQLRGRQGEPLFLAEGDLVAERALEAGCEPVAALIDPARHVPVVTRLAAAGCEVVEADEASRRELTGLAVPQPVLVLFRRPPPTDPAALVAASTHLVVVEAVDNPANIGGIVRNSAGLGWDGLLLDDTSADPYARRALRVAMGTTFLLPTARLAPSDDLATLLAGWQVVALTPDPAAVPLDRVPAAPSRALLLGAERAGLTDRARAVATVEARIPMRAGVDSLNVAAASAIACFALGPGTLSP
ncbi:MAG: RNA methyltransferase [Ilumatobacteraceae bacterium]|nr:RNA methyltransferase [Ilumatobacteraceae bacterium]